MCYSGTERVLGTLIGGWLAYGFVSASTNDGFLTAMLFVVAVAGNLIGKSLDLAYGVGKLMLLTFMAGITLLRPAQYSPCLDTKQAFATTLLFVEDNVPPSARPRHGGTSQACLSGYALCLLLPPC